MCQRVLISKNISSISSRSFERNLEAVSGMEISEMKLRRLNRSIDSLCDILYSEFNSINADDYKIIGPQLNFLLATVKNLYNTYKKITLSPKLKNQVINLWNNYSILLEINTDLVRFRLEGKKNEELAKAMKKASSLIDSI